MRMGNEQMTSPAMTPEERAAEIARELTEDEVGVLLDEGEWSDEAGLSLVRSGLAVPTMIELTDLGRAVAAHLSREPQE